MSHTIVNKKRLISRVNRIHGQLEAIRRDLEQERDYSEILQTVAACRGAMDGLLGQLIEGHIESHLTEPKANIALLKVVRSYLK